MKKITAIHQPNYIPWLGYFYKIYKADVFIFQDDVQFSNKGMHNYHNIKSQDGLLRLKIPVEGKFGSNINEFRTKDELNWKQKHLKLIEVNYRDAKYFDEVYSDLVLLLNQEYSNLAVLNSTIITFICTKLSITASLINSSDLNLTTKREEKVIDSVKATEGDIYFSGTGARAYQKEENYNAQGIQLMYSDYQPFSYPQLWGAFESNVSIVDYLMHCGFRWDIVLEPPIYVFSCI